MNARLLAALLAAPSLAQAAPALSPGPHGVWLETAAGERHRLATLTAEAAGADGAQGYALVWDDARFGDHFLSMRPFKCLEGEEKLWCRVPWPYENRRRLSAEDMVDLEYDLLFVWKGAGEYGVNLWNGVYYRLAPDGAGLSGAMHEVDLDPLGVPPAAGDLRPLGDDALHEADAESHWLPALRILPDG